jgi:hypothetical protein
MVGKIGTGTCDGLETLSLEEVLLLPVLPHQIRSLQQKIKQFKGTQCHEIFDFKFFS